MDRAQRERQAAQDRHLGWGLSLAETLPGLDIGRDISFTGGEHGRVLDLVRGPGNVAQALAVALTTLRGSDVFDTEFGFDGLNALVEPQEPVLAREQVRVGVVTLLHRDPRVSRIVDVNLDDGRLGVPGAAPDGEDPGLRSSRVLHVRVQFETITHDRLAVELGELPRV